MILAPYLVFDGNCEEAMKFYATCLDGEVTAMNRYEGSPMQVPTEFRDKILHASMVFESNTIQGCDATPEHPAVHGTDFSLSISVVEVFVLDRIFNRLAEGGTVTMPLQDTFWGARFGMVTDRFGVRWMFSCDLN